MPVIKEEPVIIQQTIWKRSNILRTQALIFADYACEIDRKHESFIAESTGKPYMEGHHIIPMKMQGEFNNSLDVYANIICLCPICHRKLHYGQKDEKTKILHQLYEEREDRFIKSGIDLSRNEFVELVV